MINSSDIKYKDSEAIKSRAQDFVQITIDTDKALESWRHSPFAHKWMDYDDGPKALPDLADKEASKAQEIMTALKNGAPITKPTLGIGIGDYVEIGSGRAQFITLTAMGVKTMPVYIPASNETFFKKFRAKDTNNESGNVLFYILIAIAMLAALSFAVSSGNNNANTQISDEKAELAASELMAYGDVLANAVAQLRLRGCADSEISFENNEIAGYTNASAPSDESCHIFSINGAGVNWQDVGANAASSASSVWTFNAAMDFENIGTNCTNSGCTELAAIVPDVKEAICIQINALNSVSTPETIPVDASSSITKFTGSYSYSNQVGDEVGSAKIAGIKGACFESTAGSYNLFYRVLTAR